MGPSGVKSSHISSVIPKREDAFVEGVRQTPKGNPAEKALGNKVLGFMYNDAVPTLRSQGMNNSSQPRSIDLPTERQAGGAGREGWVSDQGIDNGSFVSTHIRAAQGKTPSEEGVTVTLYGKHPANEPEQNLDAKFTVRDGKAQVELTRKGREGELTAKIDGNTVTWQKTTYSNGLTGTATHTNISEAEARAFLGKFQPTSPGSKGEQLLGRFDSPQLQNALKVMTEGRPTQTAWGAPRAAPTGSWG